MNLPIIRFTAGIIILCTFLFHSAYGQPIPIDKTYYDAETKTLCSETGIHFGFHLAGLNYPIFTGNLSSHFTSNMGYSIGLFYRYEGVVSAANLSLNTFRVKKTFDIDEDIWEKGILCVGGEIIVSGGYLIGISQPLTLMPLITISDLFISPRNTSHFTKTVIDVPCLGGSCVIALTKIKHDAYSMHLTFGASYPLFAKNKAIVNGTIFRAGLSVGFGI